eukprot:1065084-Pyramimonas_sp.AAC.1
MESSVWYIGQTRAARAHHRRTWYMGTARLREHFNATYRQQVSHNDRPRYRAWCGKAYESL